MPTDTQRRCMTCDEMRRRRDGAAEVAAACETLLNLNEDELRGLERATLRHLRGFHRGYAAAMSDALTGHGRTE